MNHKNRESWLNFVAAQLGRQFAKQGAPLPPKVRIAIGFPSTGRKGRVSAECWSDAASKDANFEIFIRPDFEEPKEISAILAHELCHAAVGLKERHGKKFRKIALAMGLEGKMRSTVAGPAFLAMVAPILEKAGPLPHAQLNFSGGATTRPKKQSTRLIKCECETCGYTVRTTRKWIAEAGAPVCPRRGHGQMNAELPDEDDGEGED